MAARKKKKRKKSRSKNKKVSLGNLNTTQLRNTGNQLFNINKYADAIRYFKELCSREPGEESNLLLLVQSYQKRIEELRDKGMVSEALVMAHSMEAQSGMSLPPGQMVALLCQCHKNSEAVIVYQANVDSFTGREQAELEQLFATAVLAGNEQLLDKLPLDSPIRSHYPAAEATLKAFFTKDSEQTTRELKKIPFRSPYRHFRLLISGLLRLESDPVKAKSFFDKLPVSSPYCALIELFSLSNMDVKEKVEQLVAARDTNKFNQMLTAAGLSHAQGIFLVKLFTTEPTAYGKILQLLASYPEYFSKHELEPMAMKFIVHSAEAPPALFRKILSTFSDPKLLHLMARMSEVYGNPGDSFEAWDNYLQELSVNTPNYSLRRALILRRQARFAGQTLPFYEEFNQDNGLSLLQESVELDPDDRPAWLKIIQLSQQEKSAAEAYRIVNRAVEQFPDDIEFLLKAIEATSRRGAFKKAASFADRLLKIDPINTRGKELLAGAHIAHGFKLCMQKKYSLAEKEFSAIDTEIRKPTLAGRSTICLAMLAYLQKKTEKGDTLLEKSRTLTGSLLMNALLISLEARRMKLVKSHVNGFDKTLRTVCRDIHFKQNEQNAQNERNECYEIAFWLQNSHKEESQSLKECFQAMKKYFTRAADLDWTCQEARILAEAMYSAALYPQLKKIAVNQLKTEYDDPYFRFMEIVAQTKNGEKPLSESASYELYDITSETFMEGDQSFSSRVREFSRQCQKKNPGSSFGSVNRVNSGGLLGMLSDFEKNIGSGSGGGGPDNIEEMLDMLEDFDFGGHK